MIELINLFSYSFLSALIGQAPSIPICFMFVQPACFVHLVLQCGTLRIDESIINVQRHECVKWSKAWLVQTNLSLRTRVILCGDVSLVILATREKEKKIDFMREEYDFSLEFNKKWKAPIIYTIFLHHSLGEKKGKTQIYVTKKLYYCQEPHCLIG